MWGRVLGEDVGRGFSRQTWSLELEEGQILEAYMSSWSPHQCPVPETASAMMLPLSHSPM